MLKLILERYKDLHLQLKLKKRLSNGFKKKADELPPEWRHYSNFEQEFNILNDWFSKVKRLQYQEEEYPECYAVSTKSI